MISEWTLVQHNDDPAECLEEGCLRPVYDGGRCKLHADVAAYRNFGDESGLERHSGMERHDHEYQPS